MIQLTAYMVLDRLVYCLTAARPREDGTREWVNLVLADAEVPEYIDARSAHDIAWFALQAAQVRLSGVKDGGAAPF